MRGGKTTFRIHRILSPVREPRKNRDLPNISPHLRLLSIYGGKGRKVLSDLSDLFNTALGSPCPSLLIEPPSVSLLFFGGSDPVPPLLVSDPPVSGYEGRGRHVLESSFVSTGRTPQESFQTGTPSHRSPVIKCTSRFGLSLSQ